MSLSVCLMFAVIRHVKCYCDTVIMNYATKCQFLFIPTLNIFKTQNPKMDA